MRYLLAFSYFLFKPKTGWKNGLSLGVILLIPFVGQMVALGYRSFVLEDLDDDPDKRYHRDFQFNKFSDYLTRGLWPGLIQLGVQFVLGGGFYAVFLVIMFASATQNAPPEVVLPLMAGWFVILMVTSLVVAMILWPVEMHAALRQPFDFGSSVRFVRPFLAAMWKECLAAILSFMVLATVFSTVVIFAIIAVAVGIGFAVGAAVAPLAGIIVGYLIYIFLLVAVMLPFTAIITMANGHILSQLYTVYVDKGGEPLRTRDPFEADPMLDRNEEV